MNGLVEYKNGVSSDVCDEMKTVLRKADEHIPRWLQIVDFGIGFAKNAEQNIELLNPITIKAMKSEVGNRPLLVGASRKRFMSKILGESIEMDVRDWGTAGACCSAILGGADILRVHNVKGVRSACSVFMKCIGDSKLL
jgi:dihydropteroate synthase